MLCSKIIKYSKNPFFLLSFARKKHTDQLKNLMIEIVSVILAEYETVPFALLELLLRQNYRSGKSLYTIEVQEKKNIEFVFLIVEIT